MEISEEKLQEIKEQSYLLGERQAAIGQLRTIMGYLKVDEKRTKEQYMLEREETVQALRDVCEDHGDNEWEENLHLADVVNKHLGRHLYGG